LIAAIFVIRWEADSSRREIPTESARRSAASLKTSTFSAATPFWETDWITSTPSGSSAATRGKKNISPRRPLAADRCTSQRVTALRSRSARSSIVPAEEWWTICAAGDTRSVVVRRKNSSVSRSKRRTEDTAPGIASPVSWQNSRSRSSIGLPDRRISPTFLR
jgi:hypothetical protein